MSLTRIGRYTLQGELGHGGMAAVYRAYDPSFKREVAIKILPREFLHEPTFRARFQREAQTIAALEHAAIVPVYDYGEEDGQPYLVMRLMAGGSLAERIDRGPLSLAETVEILSRIAPALDRAHAQGIIHRDLKPANILFDADGYPYIGDFGIAKLTQASTQLSGTGLMGTPAYMAPEQVRGDKQIDGRADLYALGAMLYHMLSGQRPYESDTPMGMALKHVTEPPPLVRSVRPDLPPALDGVLAKAMAKDRGQRYGTAAELLAALRAVLAAPVVPRPVADPTARPVPATVLVDPRTAGPSLAPPAIQPPASGFPLLPVALVGLALLAVAAVGVFIFIAISLYGPRPATPKATATLALAVPTSVPSGLPAPTAAPTAVAAATKAPTAAPLATTVPVATTAGLPSASPAPAGTNTPVAGATRVSNADQMVQNFVPAGPFAMGNDQGKPDQRPAHTVNLNAFWIDRTEVTNDMYGLCVRAAVCTPPQQTRSISRANYFGSPAFANFPVLFVSWTQAQAYCVWAGRRLPTEAEWEKAARGSDGRLYPWGNQAPDPKRLNFGASGVGDTVAVGQFPSNASPYGALDMAGNAWEWVADFYNAGYYAVSPADNPPGPDKTGCSGGDCRVLRGGAWDGGAQDVTTTVRLFYGQNDSRDGFTFRCAQS